MMLAQTKAMGHNDAHPTCYVTKMLPNDLLNSVERQPYYCRVWISSCCCEHHEHGLPARLDVIDAGKHHLADTADDQLTDLNSL